MSRSIDGYYEVYRETRRTARKPHICSACKETIAKGHHYTEVFIVFDGWSTHTRCARCQLIHEHLRDLSHGDLWPDENLACGEDYREHWGKDPPEEIAALAFALPVDAALKGGR